MARAGFRQVAVALERSARALAASGARVHLLVVDDEESTGLYGQRPVPATNVDAVRHHVDSVGAEIVKEDRTIDAILLIGGDDVPSFFRLPNPSDDDACVLSDNPYGATSRNLYLPDVAVGRLPDADETRPAFLCHLIEAIPIRRARPTGFAGGCLLAPLRVLAQRLPVVHASGVVFASAAAQDAVSEVRNALGSQIRLELCPPTAAHTLGARQISGTRLLYFDLLGSRASARWYGRKDRSHPKAAPALPIAFESGDAAGAQVDDGVVYSACSYGARVVGKNARTCTTLRFLAEGAAVVVDSIGIAYGVVQPPLSGANLLGVFLGRYLLDGPPIDRPTAAVNSTIERRVVDHLTDLCGERLTRLRFVRQVHCNGECANERHRSVDRPTHPHTVMIVSHDPGIASRLHRVGAVRDGKVSTETRRIALADETVDEELVVLDGSLRLPIPAALTEQAGFGDRVRVEIEDDHITIRPAPRRPTGGAATK